MSNSILLMLRKTLTKVRIKINLLEGDIMYFKDPHQTIQGKSIPNQPSLSFFTFISLQTFYYIKKKVKCQCCGFQNYVLACNHAGYVPFKVKSTVGCCLL